MNHSVMDLDPLSNYEYPSYDSYPVSTAQQYPCHVKLEDSLYYNQPNNTAQTNYTNPNYVPNTTNVPQPTSNETQPQPTKTEPCNDKEEKVNIAKKKTKKNGKNFCSEKINDASFPFYGCSVCNISFSSLHELDQHVTIHKNRMTSYRLRLRNQFKKKQIKKERKKLKKLRKVKKEMDVEVEIKPEDGYIGNERAADYNNGNTVTEYETNISENSNRVPVINNGNTNTEVVPKDNITNNSIITNTAIVTNNRENSNMKLMKTNIDVKVGKTSNDFVTSNNENTVQGPNNSSTNDDNCRINNDSNDVDEAELNNLEKIYKCFACQKQFTLSYYLKLHVRSHTDEKPYTCSVCGQSFITASKLGRHNKRIHLAARFQCRICFKIFSRFELLTNHFDKSHPEDKLEGEPYDYNAILPYLKELEEQLRVQSETKQEKKDDWLESGVQPPNTEAIKEEEGEDQNLLQKMEVIVEEVKVDGFEVEVKVKQEVEDSETNQEVDEPPVVDEPPGDDFRDDDDHNKDFKEDSFSDDDYFPSNTWAATPKCDPSPPPSPKRKKTSAFKRKTCEICNKEISSASYLRVHMRTHTGEKPFKCYKCGRGFITSSKMNRHVLTHGNDVKQEGIKEENAEVKSEEGDTSTEEESPDSTKTTKKKKIQKKSKKLLNGGEKSKKKHQKRPHSCEYCNQKFLHLNMLEVHKKCHEGEELVFKCHFCLEEAIDACALKEHEATHVGPKPYLCTICGKTYKKRETMVYHRKHHQPEREYICDICSKRFNAACKLAKHMVTHRSDQYVLRYECPVCAHMFNTKYHVQMHLSTHQREGLIMESNRNEVLAMVLQNALKIPKQPDAAANLTDITPSDERYRICKICGETFHHFYYLEEHLKSHGSKIAIDDTTKAEEKKYICEICNKGFKLHYYLKLHSFTHSKEKPFMCQQCGKGFITKGKLKRHLETHSGLKKYQCHICYKFFTRPSYLRIHIRTIHGTQDYNYRLDKSCLSLSAMSAITQISDSQNSV